MATNRTERMVVKAALRVVKIADLNFDPSYQRGIKPNHKKIIANFNEKALGIPLVGEREDGSLWVIDGRQRITALSKMGWTQVRVEVQNSKGPEEEAAVFNKVNGLRTKIAPAELFQSLLTEGELTAWAVKETAEAEGFKINKHNGGHRRPNIENASRNLACHAMLLSIVRLRGVEALRFTLSVIKDAWPEDTQGINKIVIGGLSIWWKRHEGDADKARLIPRLQSTTPAKLMYIARQMTLGGDAIQQFADQVEKLYLKRSPKK